MQEEAERLENLLRLDLLACSLGLVLSPDFPGLGVLQPAFMGVLQPGFMGMAKGQNVQFRVAHIMVSGNRINYTADVNSLQLCQRYGSLQ